MGLPAHSVPAHSRRPWSVAAVGIASTLNFQCQAALQGISSAVQAMTARRVGEGRTSEAGPARSCPSLAQPDCAHSIAACLYTLLYPPPGLATGTLRASYPPPGLATGTLRASFPDVLLAVYRWPCCEAAIPLNAALVMCVVLGFPMAVAGFIAAPIVVGQLSLTPA